LGTRGSVRCGSDRGADSDGNRSRQFRKTLDKFKVPANEQEELILIVGSTKKDIVKQGTN
jgi:hypothetical protein